jgi:long-chain acyl-CoA synthetase
MKLMAIDFLLERFQSSSEKDAIIWRDRSYTYGWLYDSIVSWSKRLEKAGVHPGSVVSVEADFSPNAVGLLLTLVQNKCVVVPLTPAVEAQKNEFRNIAEVEWIVQLDDLDQVEIKKTEIQVQNSLLKQLKSGGHPGLVLFSSGSTGKSKAAVHDFLPLLEKFQTQRHTLRSLTFLLFDHIGGVNTLFYNLSNLGLLVTVQDRNPATICRLIEKHQVQLLPTSPTFINLLLLSEAYREHDISSLELVTYGTEVMPESTLKRFHSHFPGIKLQQTYGLSELGILRSKSKSSDSLWVKVGGDGFETRVVNGLLEIKAKSAMLGYLNAPSPFTEDGWFKTGDAVEVDGEYLKILGRRSEIINVGGEKVYPIEVESVILSMPGVKEVIVDGEPHPITGNIVRARVSLDSEELLSDFRKRLRAFCKDRLPMFKIPQKVEIVQSPMHNARFKKQRHSHANEPGKIPSS